MSKVVNKAILILSSFSTDHPHLRPDEIAQISGIPLSTVYRFIQGLLKAGYLTKDSNGQTYHLGPAILRLGRTAESGLEFRALAITWMEKLFKKTNQTISLSVPYGHLRLVLDSLEPKGGVKFSVRPGSTAPIFVAGSGKILLAFTPKAELGSVLEGILKSRLKPQLITSAKKLLKQLDQIRACGYGYSEAELFPGAWALSAPLLNKDGIAQAALTISGVLNPNSKPNIRPLLKLLFEATQDISRELGYVGRIPGLRAIRQMPVTRKTQGYKTEFLPLS
jgi:DNA-binding IclR family transcriptional regulator